MYFVKLKHRVIMKKILLVVSAVLCATTFANAQTWGIKGGFNYSNYQVRLKDANVGLNPGSKPGFYLGGTFNTYIAPSVGLQVELMYAYDGTRTVLKEDLIKNFTSMIPTLPAVKNDAVIGTANHNLRLPIMLKLEPTGRLSVMGGVYLSYTIDNEVRFGKDMADEYKDQVKNASTMGVQMPSYSRLTDELADIVSDNQNKFDFGLTAGVEYKFVSGFFIDARYTISMLDGVKDKLKVKSELLNQNIDIKYKDMYGIEPKVRFSSFQVGLGYRF